MRSDIEIANAATLRPITEVAAATLGIDEENLVPYGRHKAKVDLGYLASLADRPLGKLVLVTAMSPTPAGEGKTTRTVGLTDALHGLGRRTVACLREPSMGPVFAVFTKNSYSMFATLSASGLTLPGPVFVNADESLRPWPFSSCGSFTGKMSLRTFAGPRSSL